MGRDTLSANTTGSSNTGIGYASLQANTTAGGNTAVGTSSLRACTTGDAHTVMGFEAGEDLTTGAHAVFLGYRAAMNSTTGNYNVVIGSNTCANMTTGSNNTVIGYGAGSGISGSSNSVLLGFDAETSAGGHSELVLGANSVGKGDNTGFINPPSSGSLYQGNNSSAWATTSDRRIKKNIVDNNIGLDAINEIQVRNFEYRTEDEITDFENTKSAVVNKEGIQLGVIAQEIETVLPDMVETQSTGVKTVNPDNMTWYLVNAVKELSAQVEELKAKLNEGE